MQDDSSKISTEDSCRWGRTDSQRAEISVNNMNCSVVHADGLVAKG